MNPLKKDGDRYAYKKASTRKERTITAYHEAGHAVVALHFGVHVKSVDIIPVPDAGRVGFCRMSLAQWDLGFRYYPMFLLGGPVAEFVHRCRGLAGALNISCAIGAYGSVLAVLRRMGGQDFSDISNTDPAVTDDMLLSLVTDTAGLVTMPKMWARVEAVAKALLERQKISGDELSDICYAVRKPSRVDVSWARERLGASGSVEDIVLGGHLPWAAV